MNCAQVLLLSGHSLHEGVVFLQSVQNTAQVNRPWRRPSWVGDEQVGVQALTGVQEHQHEGVRLGSADPRCTPTISVFERNQVSLFHPEGTGLQCPLHRRDLVEERVRQQAPQAMALRILCQPDKRVVPGGVVQRSAQVLMEAGVRA